LISLGIAAAAFTVVGGPEAVAKISDFGLTCHHLIVLNDLGVNLNYHGGNCTDYDYCFRGRQAAFR
jgi:hypothetical protein